MKSFLRIPADVIDAMNKILAGPQLTDTKSDAVVQTFTARFPGGYEADIKVCNGDSPWIDAVLFDTDGSEVACREADDGPLEGEYDWVVGNKHYTVVVQEVAPC